MADYGMLQEVIREPRTATVTAAAAIADTELVVDDAGDYNEDGGTLVVNDVEYAYSAITWGSTEDGTDTIILADPLTAAVDEGDQVAPSLAGSAIEDWYAVVDLGAGDAAHIPLRFEQRLAYVPGIKEPPVPVVVSEDLERIEDSPGRVPTSAVLFYEDQFTVTAEGDQTFTLTFLPLDHSAHVRWHPNGLGGVFNQEGDTWSIDDLTLTIPDADGLLRIGDVFTVKYAYYVGGPTGITTPADPEPPPDPDPDPGATLIVPDEAVTLNSTFSWGGAVLGLPPQWGDDDAGTGAEMYIRYGTAVVNKRQSASTNFEAKPTLVVDPDARIAIWYTVISSDLEYGFTVTLQPTTFSGVKLTSDVGAGGLAAPAGWDVVEMLPNAGRTIEEFLTDWLTQTQWLQVSPNWPPGAEPSGLITKHISIGEVRVAIYYP